MAGEARKFVKAAKKLGLREGKRGQGPDAVQLLDTEDRVVFRGSVHGPDGYTMAKKALREKGYDLP